MPERGARRGDKTNPRLDAGGSISAEWDLQTVAAPVDEARSMVEAALPNQARQSKYDSVAHRPTGPIARIVHANPVATFAAGFVAGTILMLILWSVL